MRRFPFIYIVLLLIVSSLVGCKTTRYVPVEKVVYRDVLKYDTVQQHDSVWIHDSIMQKQKGDTTFIDRWHYETKYKYLYRNKVDSFVRQDSILVPYPVEKSLSKWEQFQLRYAAWSFGALCMILLYLSVKLYRKNKNEVDRNQYQ